MKSCKVARSAEENPRVAEAASVKVAESEGFTPRTIVMTSARVAGSVDKNLVKPVACMATPSDSDRLSAALMASPRVAVSD